MKIIKIMSVSILVMTLSGCFFQSISIDKIDAAKELCKEYDSNLYKVYEYWAGATDVKCIDESLKPKEYSLDNYLYNKRLKMAAGGKYEKE